MSDFIDISIIGNKKLQSRIKRLDFAIQKKIVRQSINRAMLPVRDRAKQYVPVDTGRLRDSIKRVSRTRRGKSSARVVTGTKQQLGIPSSAKGYYPAAIEYGSRYQQAQSFLRRAMTELKSATLDKTGEFIDQYIRKELRR